jgi:hypothetical protein
MERDTDTSISAAETIAETGPSIVQLEALATLEEEHGLVITRDQIDFVALDRALADPSLSREDVITASFARAVAAMVLGYLSKAAELNRRHMLAAAGVVAVGIVLRNSPEISSRFQFVCGTAV